MNLTWRAVRLRLREPFRIARSVMSEREAVQVGLAHGGDNGHGEVVTSKYLGLSRSAIVEALVGLRPLVAGCPDPEELLTDLPRLAVRSSVAPSVLAAIDAAGHDLVGKRASVPVHRLVGNPSWTPVQTFRTIGLDTPERASALARDLVQRGFRAIKVKAGAEDPDVDEARLAAVRAAAPHARLLVDPNGAWSPDQAVRVLDRLAALDIDAVEQPIPPGDPDRLAWVGARCPAPLIADEDAATEADIHRLAGVVAGVNVKLARCGGIRAAHRIATAAGRRGMDIMLGCLVASSLGIAPAVHLTGAARWVDLDGHLLLAHDPWTGIGGADGTLRLSGRPGLGVRHR